MLRASSGICDEAFWRGVIGFELWTAFARSIQWCVQGLLGHLRWGSLQMSPQFSEPCIIFVEISISDTLLGSEHVSVGDCKISTTVINSKT